MAREEKHCRRCGKRWVPMTEERPKMCPACKSKLWDVPRMEHVDGRNQGQKEDEVRVRQSVGGSKGGKTTAARMTPEDRTKRASLAARTRWSKMLGQRGPVTTTRQFEEEAVALLKKNPSLVPPFVKGISICESGCGIESYIGIDVETGEPTKIPIPGRVPYTHKKLGVGQA